MGHIHAHWLSIIIIKKYMENTFGDWFSINGHSLTEITDNYSPVVSAIKSPGYDDSVAEKR